MRIQTQRSRSWGFTSLWTQPPNNSPQGERLGRGQAPWRINHPKSKHQPSLLWGQILQYKLLPQSHQERTPNLCPDLQKLSKDTPTDHFLFLLHFNDYQLLEVPPINHLMEKPWPAKSHTGQNSTHRGARASDPSLGGLHL